MSGNFLLDIGPRADGSIPEILQTRLRETGDWLKVNGESVYGTTYWSRMAASGPLRFSVKQNEAFYMSSLERPGDQLVVDAPVPAKDGDRVTMLGYPGELKWSKRTASSLSTCRRRRARRVSTRGCSKSNIADSAT